MALRSDGLIFGTGGNANGQIGNNTLTSRRTFVQALGVSDVATVIAGHSHTVALRSDGLIFSSGANASGQFGDDTTTPRSTFVPALGISNVVAAACGSGYTLPYDQMDWFLLVDQTPTPCWATIPLPTEVLSFKLLGFQMLWLYQQDT